jgi:hypothetical protein
MNNSELLQAFQTASKNLFLTPLVSQADVDAFGVEGHVLNLCKWKIMVINVGVRLLNGIRTSSLPKLPQY